MKINMEYPNNTQTLLSYFTFFLHFSLSPSPLITLSIILSTSITTFSLYIFYIYFLTPLSLSTLYPYFYLQFLPVCSRHSPSPFPPHFLTPLSLSTFSLHSFHFSLRWSLDFPSTFSLHFFFLFSRSTFSLHFPSLLCTSPFLYTLSLQFLSSFSLYFIAPLSHSISFLPTHSTYFQFALTAFTLYFLYLLSSSTFFVFSLYFSATF